jgi:geranylgeranyl diphosphate synthase, type I
MKPEDPGTPGSARDPARLREFLARTQARLLEHLARDPRAARFLPEDLGESVWSYVRRPAKRLRPSVLLLSCGSVGGDPECALPAAAAVELFHTWTLVHDDLIDNDLLRRGAPTVHAAIAARKRLAPGASEAQALDYGRDIAILTGDVQHGWAVAQLLQCAQRGVDPAVVIALAAELEGEVLPGLIEGEALDVQLAMAGPGEWRSIREEDVLRMLGLKTGLLYRFCGFAGALIGRNALEREHPHVRALAEFAGDCGLAFQLQDDVLGVAGDERRLGKAVGSDIREGKKTVVALAALRNASEAQRGELLATLGNPRATPAEVERAHRLFQELGGVDRARSLACQVLERAVGALERVPESSHRDLLLDWAEFTVRRDS